MRYAVKTALVSQAWRLGDHADPEQALTAQGRIRLRPGGIYELFSREATGDTGQLAQAGDYFKVDSAGYPYPIRRDAFEATHTPLGDGLYRETPRPLPIWTAEEPMNDAVRFLLDTGALLLRPEDPAHFFSASLWGATETAARDAVILLHAIRRDGDGQVAQVDFNFVARDEFEKTDALLDGAPSPAAAGADGA